MLVHGARIELARRFHETDYESAAAPFGVPWLVYNGRGDEIRTHDPLLPKQMLYQTEPHPDLFIKRIFLIQEDQYRNKHHHAYRQILLLRYLRKECF